MSDQVSQPANYQDIANALDQQVRAGQITPEQALAAAQASGLTTGEGGYLPPGYAAATAQARADEAYRLNEISRQSAARSEAYQKQAVGGYSEADQDAFNAAHPLSDY